MLPCQRYGTVGLVGLVIMTINTWVWSRLNYVNKQLSEFSASGWFFIGKKC